MREFTIKRDYDISLRFIGEKLACIRDDVYGTNLITEYSLYKTKGGKFICQQIDMVIQYKWLFFKCFQSNKHIAIVANNLNEVSMFFEEERIRKKIYKAAGIEFFEEIE